MDEKPEERGQELYYKLNSEYLIECAENERIDEWNAQYLEYLALEWNRLYHPREWGQKNILELVRHSHFRRPDFSRGDFREVTSRKVLFVGIPMDRAPLEGEPLEEKHLEGLHLEGAKFWQAHMEGAKFWGHIWKEHSSGMHV